MKRSDTNTTSKAKAEPIKLNSFSVDRVHQFQNGSVVVDLTLNDIKIYGVKVVESTKKDTPDFLSFPQRKGNDGKYYSIAYAYLSKEDQADIIAEIEKQL